MFRFIVMGRSTTVWPFFQSFLIFSGLLTIADAAEMGIKLKQHNNTTGEHKFMCALCQISCGCERDLHMHQTGQKHMRRLKPQEEAPKNQKKKPTKSKNTKKVEFFLLYWIWLRRINFIANYVK